jgi:4-hydroxybenzoate polyprenyltransferase
MWILILTSPFVAAAAFYFPSAMPSLLAFLLFSIFYSAPPIRAKAVPFLDSAFNVLYIFPGAFGYQLLAGTFPPVRLMLAAGLWTAAMHAYSAIPDIEADRDANLNTIATFCGPFGALAICGFLYAAAAIISFEYLGFVSVSLGFAYVLLMLASVRSVRTDRLFKLYRSFPLINIIAGFIIFWDIALLKLF